MKFVKYAIVGSGLCSFIASLRINNSLVLAKLQYNKSNVFRVLNFYEFNNPGGNTNIWGAYINLKRFKKYLDLDKKFSDFYKSNKFFTFARISKKKEFKHIGYIKNIRSNKIFRLNKSFFTNNKNFYLKKILISKKFVYLFSDNNSYKVKCLNLCIGNFGLIKVLKNSDIIKDNDIVSYEDSSIKYTFNVNLKHKKYYYIPMSIRQIIEKLIYKSNFYRANENDNNIFVQAIDNKKKTFKIKVDELLNSKKSFHRGMNTNHIANMKINGVPVEKYLQKKTKRIKINCSGTLPRYISGSISQDLIYNTFKKS